VELSNKLLIKVIFTQEKTKFGTYCRIIGFEAILWQLLEGSYTSIKIPTIGTVNATILERGSKLSTCFSI